MTHLGVKFDRSFSFKDHVIAKARKGIRNGNECHANVEQKVVAISIQGACPLHQLSILWLLSLSALSRSKGMKKYKMGP
jgi:hypothetical protein